MIKVEKTAKTLDEGIKKPNERLVNLTMKECQLETVRMN